MPVALVVDRDVLVRNVVRGALVLHGFEAMDAADADEASLLCRSFSDEQLGLLIIEYCLAIENSGALFKRLTQSCPTSKVILTAAASYQQVLEMGGIPATASFLQKPFTSDQLMAAVNDMMRPPSIH